MDITIDWVEKKFMFEDEFITAKLRPLKRSAMAKITPMIANAMGKEDDMAYVVGSTFEMQEVAAKVFPDHVKDIKGITVNGNPLTINQLVEEAVFGRLAVEILSTLFTMSTLTKVDEKNLGGQSNSTIMLNKSEES